jgi:hypothetical protein
MHLIEQYGRLAVIQTAWQLQRDQASSELEALARRLFEQEQDLESRASHADATEQLLRQRQDEIDAVRADIQRWRDDLHGREQAVEESRQRNLLDLQQKEAILQEQSDALSKLRERWMEQRRQEVEQVRELRAALENDHAELRARRLAMFEQSQQMAEEKRALSEKMLALEHYRQEVLLRTKDPDSQQRLEGLRRRWLTLNAELLRQVKNEAAAAQGELGRIETERTALAQLREQTVESDQKLTEKLSLFEEKEIALNARQALFEQRLASLEAPSVPFKSAAETKVPPQLDKAA